MATAPAGGSGGGGGGSGGGDSQILREYLVALGFRIDEQRHRRFTGVLEGLDKMAVRAGLGLLGIGVAAATMAHTFARSMEQLGFSARYANTTVEAVKALEYAGTRAGLAGGKLMGVITGMNAAMERSPGLRQFLESMGVATRGPGGTDRKTDELFLDTLQALEGLWKQGPGSVGRATAYDIGEQLGMDQETLGKILVDLPKFRADMEKQRAIMREMGVDQEKLNKQAHEYMELWSEVKVRAEAFGEVLSGLALGPMKALLGDTNELLTRWTRIAVKAKNFDDFIGESGKDVIDRAERGGRENLSHKPFTRYSKDSTVWKWLQEFSEYRDTADFEKYLADPKYGHPILRKLGLMDENGNVRRWLDEPFGKGKGGGNLSASRLKELGIVDDDSSVAGEDQDRGAVPAGMSQGEFIAALERYYKLPPGLLDFVWSKESTRSQNPAMYTPGAAGELGPFQIRRATGAAVGLKTDDDFINLGTAAPAAAEILMKLLEKYGGDTRSAIAAWNWGETNVDRLGVSRAPGSTQQYMNEAVRAVNINTEIHNHGQSDPEATGAVNARQLPRILNDAARNMSPKVR